MPRRMLHACVVAACLCSACAEPPNKEMDQAQGAIDAARAAGAEQYAGTEFTAATSALTQAHDAVAVRDYRLALNHALTSRQSAQDAARQAATTRARLRGEAERSMAEIAALVAQARSRIALATGARVRRRLRGSDQALTEIAAGLQEAGTAMEADDYVAVQPVLAGLRKKAEVTLTEIDATLGAQSPRRPR